jgi:cytochrome c biogenesis protein CcmG/thiol:disulfide interchange protein DsbE
MERNNEMDDRLSSLGEAGEWRPDVEHGLALFRQGRRNARVRARRWLWGSGAALATALCVMALPVTRVFANRCVDACVAAFSPPGALAAPVTGEVAPDFTAVDSAGARLRLSDFKGRVTVLNFWASWCVPCAEETPWFIEFQQKYGRDGLAVIGVSLDDDGWKSVKPFIGGMGVNYRMVLIDSRIARLYGGLEALPVTVVIDRSGRVAATYVGLIGHDEFEGSIRAMLDEAQVTVRGDR